MKYKLDSIANYAKKNAVRYQKIDGDKRQYIRAYSDTDRYVKGQCMRGTFKTPDVYYAQIRYAFLFGDTDGIVVGNRFLSDRVIWDKEGVGAYLPWCIDGVDIDKSSVDLNIKLDSAKRIKKGISLIKMWGGNYYHLTMEILSRLISVENEYLDYPLLIDEDVLSDSKNKELIKLVNKEKRKIIPIKKGKAYFVEDMVFPSYCTWGKHSKTDLEVGNGVAMYPEAVRFIRSRVFEKICEEMKEDYKVFLIRGNDKRLTNESKLIKFFSGKDYEIINPDSLSIVDEIKLIQKASVIVGCGGAGFTNVIFCNQNVKVYQICPIELQYVSNLYSELALAVGVKLFSLNATIKDYGVNMNKSSFYISEDDVTHTMEMIEAYEEDN
ncbi:glycosyltransferase family 61 protein [Butyrivibrio proteoclasticus]|uniref:glycosyltransferase family 61 protein n=1 Tax=Butyrivibrio proteoclasticus TaxID=43305 RepID=UPI0004787400|nr:glycosyltransferase family 61 protein [Butyrivibrio proteoclasticus]